jgi:hypothetical protein
MFKPLFPLFGVKSIEQLKEAVELNKSIMDFNYPGEEPPPVILDSISSKKIGTQD